MEIKLENQQILVNSSVEDALEELLDEGGELVFAIVGVADKFQVCFPAANDKTSMLLEELALCLRTAADFVEEKNQKVQ